MLDIRENVRKDVKKLIPSSIIGDVTCFVFYDHHPKDEKAIDVSVCTKDGDLKEFFRRDVINTIKLNCKSAPEQLSIARNNNSELFYLVRAEDDLFVISRKDKLRMVNKLTNIGRYSCIDVPCSGLSYLKVIKKDDKVSVCFDDNFELIEDRKILPTKPNDDEYSPVLTELRRKLVEAKYTIKFNEKAYKHYTNLRQRVSMMTYESLHINLSSTIEDKMKDTVGALILKTQTPWIKVCNKKIIIILIVLNESKEPIEDIQILLNSKVVPSLVYKTKLLTKISKSPFWLENDTHNIKPNLETAIVAVIDLEELRRNILRPIALSGLVSYKMFEKEFLLPFDEVSISSFQSMGDEFDVLSKQAKDHNTILAIMAATEKTELLLRYIRNKKMPIVSLLDQFCNHLQMEKVGNTKNVIVYRKSPYHALNGTMIVFHDINVANPLVSVYTRSPSQVLALLHCMYDAIPAKIIATIPTYRITGKTEEMSEFNEKIPEITRNVNYLNYASSILNRNTKILAHLDNSMIKMSESRNPFVLSKMGNSVDVFAGGVNKFKEFRENMFEEAKKGVDVLIKSDCADEDKEPNTMVID